MEAAAAYAWAMVSVVRPRVRTSTRFVLFAQGRTGSTLLQGLLNQHPAIYIQNEPLSPRRRLPGIGPERVLHRESLLSARQGHDAVGVHIKPYDLTNTYAVDPAEFLGRLADDGWLFIHLVREDAIGHALSRMRAGHSGRYHLRADADDDSAAPMHIDPSRLIRGARWRQQVAELEVAVLSDVDHLRVTYEADLLDAERHQATADRCFAHLGVEPVPVRASFKRTAATRPEVAIENYTELRAAVEKAGFVSTAL